MVESPALPRRAAGTVPLVALVLLACGESASEPPPPPPQEVLVSIDVTPDAPTLAALGQTVTLEATGTGSEGSVMSLGSLTWASSAEDVATVSSSGVVTAVGNGAALISATQDDVTGEVTVTVRQEVDAVSVTPSEHTLRGLGSTTTLEAVAVDANDHAVADAAFTWTTTDAGVVEVEGAGVVTARGLGGAFVRAAAEGVADSAALSVTAGAASALTYVEDPSDAVANHAIAPTVEVEVVDVDGLRAADASVTITLTVEAGDAVEISGNVAAAVEGRASFPDLTVVTPGTDYTLVASAPDLAAATSGLFSIARDPEFDYDGDGYSVAAGDCDDDDAIRHPGATDLPDAEYADLDCDGMDGEEDNAVFVATAGADDAGCGTLADPCLTITHALSVASDLGLRDVYVAEGPYAEAIVLVDGINVFGGFGTDFVRSPDHTVRVLGATDVIVATRTEAVTLVAEDLTAETMVADLELYGPDVSTRLPGGQGRNSLVVYARNVPADVLTLTRLVLVGGAAASGRAGASGSGLTSRAPSGSSGGNAAEFSSTCSTHRQPGGTGATNSSIGTDSRGGTGGRGGSMDTDCDLFSPNLDATAGTAGFNANIWSASGGRGGAAGAPCVAGGAGFRGIQGVSGSGGAGGGGRGLLISAVWQGRDGTNGSLGSHGNGGGGGGGSGGCDIGTDSYGAGGGGGGAGGARASAAGQGGGAGGGSFVLHLIDASPTLTASSIVRGSGGVGGRGGAGASGQLGGFGGNGGSGDGDSGPGGPGGGGGDGGASGAGGGGAGGPSYAVFAYGSSSISLDGIDITGGIAGPGGAGGSAAPGGNAGQTGASGGVGEILTCASAGGC